MANVRDIDILIKKYEERLQGLQEMAAVEEDAHYGTALLGTPETTGYELSICLDALRMLRERTMEDEKADRDPNPRRGSLHNGSRTDDIS